MTKPAVPKIRYSNMTLSQNSREKINKKKKKGKKKERETIEQWIRVILPFQTHESNLRTLDLNDSHDPQSHSQRRVVAESLQLSTRNSILWRMIPDLLADQVIDLCR